MAGMARGRRCYYGIRAINKLHTVYWQYHSSVSALPLVPTVLVTIQQQTHDIHQYTVCNLYLLLIIIAATLELYSSVT